MKIGGKFATRHPNSSRNMAGRILDAFGKLLRKRPLTYTGNSRGIFPQNYIHNIMAVEAVK